MGYTTEFEGHFDISPAIAPEHAAYLNKFAGTRRMQRYADVLTGRKFPDPIREAVGLPIGEDGEYFVGGTGVAGQDRDASVDDYNRPPNDQPGLWCKWVVGKTVNGDDVVVWDGGEKFYAYIEWLQYLIDRFFKPWGYTLHGVVTWWGESKGDIGEIDVIDNEIKVTFG